MGVKERLNEVATERRSDEAIGREDQIYAVSFRRHPRCDATRHDAFSELHVDRAATNGRV